MDPQQQIDMSRATVIGMKTQDFDQVQQIGQQLLSQNVLKLQNLLEKAQKHPLLRQQTDVIQGLFQDHLELVIEMIQWMFQPDKIVMRKGLKQEGSSVQQVKKQVQNNKNQNVNIAKRASSKLSSPEKSVQKNENKNTTNINTSNNNQNNQKYKRGLFSQPFLCKNFIEKNYYFYELMYQAAKYQKLPISLWFNFLTSHGEQIRKSSILKNESHQKRFSQGQNQSQFQDQNQLAFNKNIKNSIQQQQQFSEVFTTSLGYFHDVMIPFIAHDYHSNAYLYLSTNIGQKQSDAQSTVLKIFPKHLIDSLLQICHIQVVFKFLYKLVIVSLQEPSQINRASQILQKLFLKIKQNKRGDNIINHCCILFKEIYDNISNDSIGRASVFMQYLVKTGITQYCIQRISDSFLCKPYLVKLQGQKQKIRFSTTSVRTQNQNQNQGSGPGSPKKSLPKTRSLKVFTEQQVQIEQQILQDYFKFLTLLVTIYTKLYKDNRVIFTQTIGVQGSCMKLKITSPKKPQGQIEKVKKKQSQSHQSLNLLQGQVLNIIKSLSCLNQLAQQSMQRTILFSSGQVIKPLTLVKFSYFQLLLQCLYVVKDLPQKFVIDMDSLDLFLLIQRYLSENRWNNIFHHTLQKITNLLLTNNYNFFKKNNMEKSNIANSFLGYLTQNFTNKDYIYLNTFNFTNQGNLHSIYKIAKTVAYELNNNQILTELFDSFQPWKRFVLIDLKRYQQRTFDTGVKVPEQQAEKYQEKQKCSGKINITIDEADSIKKLISNITFTQRWPNKMIIRKKKISSALHRSSDHHHRAHSNKTDSKRDRQSPPKKSITSDDKNCRQNIDHNEDQNNHLNPIKQLRLSYPPIIGKLNFQNQDLDFLQEQKQTRIGKYFFTRAKSSKQFDKDQVLSNSAPLNDDTIIQKNLSSEKNL